MEKRNDMKPMSHRVFGWGIKSIHGYFLYPMFYKYKKEAMVFAKFNCSNHPEIDYKTVYKIVKVEVIEV